MDIKIDKIIRSRRKTFSIKISSDGLITMSVPLNANDSHIAEVLKLKEDWIRKKLQTIKNRKIVERNYAHGSTLHLFGEEFLINLVPDFKYAMKYSNNTIFIASDLSSKIKEYLPQLIRHIAKPRFYNRTMDYARKMNLKVASVKISSAKKRWGSCSNRGSINLNWRLAFAPLEVIDYVIIHELAHIAELNHSKKFWKIVEKYCPNYKTHLKWLKDNSYTLEV